MGNLPVTAFFLGILTLGGGVLFHVIAALGLGRRLRLPFWEIAGPLQWLLLLPPFSWYGSWKLHRRARELAQAPPEVVAQFAAEATPPALPASTTPLVFLPPEIAQRRPTATVAIAAVIGVVFALQLLFHATEQTHLLVQMGALVASRVQAGEIWRLASCTFLHAGVMHFALNVIVLIAIGFQLERAIGSPRFVLIYAASALGGSFASMTFMHSVSVGASGAVWGLMAAQFVLAKYSKDVLPQPLQDAMLRSAGQNLMLNMLNSFRPGVDWAAHLGGGVVGAALMAATLASLPRLRGFASVAAPEPAAAKPDPAWLRPLAAAGALALLLGLGLALFRGQVWQASAPPRYQRVELTGAGISAEIPSGLTLNRSPNPGSNFRQFSYGTIMADPVVVGILLPAQPAKIADLDGAYTANRTALEKEQSGGKSGGQVTERRIRGRRVLEKSHDFDNGVRLRTLVEITPTGFRRVDCLRRPGLAAEWNGVAEHTLLSIDPGAGSGTRP
jgi:membrane associated rhomboid family serine protease